MKSRFQENLKLLAKRYSQKYIAEKTGVAQSSINNYLTKSIEPSMQFLIALKNAFGISIDAFLFSEYEEPVQKKLDRFIGNYIVYYYNNDSYKGEVHTNLKNTLKYGVISIIKDSNLSKDIKVLSIFTKSRVEATKLLKRLNSVSKDKIIDEYNDENVYVGKIDSNDMNIFIEIENKNAQDKSYIILNNPQTNAEYIGGVGTVNSISRGREHNPCSQFIIISKKLLDVPDGEIYNLLKFNDFSINIDDSVKDIVELFKRLYTFENEISSGLTETQKFAIIKNKIEYVLSDVVEANAFRFAKISNREDDAVYRLIKEGIDV